MRQRHDRNGWAQQVPRSRFRSPYRDYGWESQQSALPEFRDPSAHFMPDERQELGAWEGTYGRTVVDPARLPAGGGRLDWNRRGPHTGKGPRGYTRSDERIYDEICSRMTEHGSLDAHDVEVQVEDGEVTLTGKVRDRRSKRLAEDIVDTVYGVEDVHNQLDLQPDQTPARWRDEVGRSGVYPASEAGQAPEDATPQGEASWGQGTRGAEGYNDSGRSEIHPPRPEKKS